MGTRLVQPGLRKVADAAFPNENMVAAFTGDTFDVLCSYLSSPSTNPKNWTNQRIDWCVEHHVGIGMFCEQYETIVHLGYSRANLDLGSQCEAMANAFGYPDDCPMWYAVDTSPFGHEADIVSSFQAYRATNHRPLGVYGGSQIIERLMDEGLVQYGHIPSAVSWSATSAPYDGVTVFTYNNGKNRWYRTPRAHMFQHPSEAYGGGRIDANDVYKPTPFWFPWESDLNPQDNDMELGHRIIIPVRDDGQECDARFVAFCEDSWFSTMTWCDSWRTQAWLSKPIPTLRVPLGNLRGGVLEGKMPSGDRYHDWSRADFFGWVPDSEGVTPHGQFQVTIPAQTQTVVF